MRILLAMALAAPFLILRPALAQDAATLAASEKLMQKMEVVETLNLLLPQIGQGIVAAIADRNPGKQKEAVEIWQNWLLPEMQASAPQFLQIMAQLYAQTFTKEELEAMIAFYDTPAGKKIIRVQADMGMKTVQLGSQWGESAARSAIQKYAEQIRGKGLSL